MSKPVVFVALMLSASAACAAPAVTMASRDSIRSEIKARCQQQMSQYGDQMILACMEQDWEGAQKVMDYEKTQPAIADRCLAQMREYGFAMVAACIEQDVSASSKIKNW